MNRQLQNLLKIKALLAVAMQYKTEVEIIRRLNAWGIFIDQHTRQMIAAFNGLWERQRLLITNTAVKESLVNFNVTPALQQQLHEGIIKFTEEEFKPLYKKMIGLAGAAEAKRIIEAINKPMSFDIDTSQINSLVDRQGLLRVIDMSPKQIGQIKSVLDHSVSNGWGVNKTARAMRSTIDLTPKQLERFVYTYKRNLLKKGLKRSEIDRLVNIRIKSLRNMRAETIAQTELNHAYNQGNLESVRQAMEQGVIKGAWKIWHTSLDDQVRDEHVVLESEKVSVNETFSNGSDYPDAVNERCEMETIVEV